MPVSCRVTMSSHFSMSHATILSRRNPLRIPPPQFRVSCQCVGSLVSYNSLSHSTVVRLHFPFIRVCTSVSRLPRCLFTGTKVNGAALRLARRTRRPQALSSSTGLCAGAPAGRSADGVCTTQLLGTRAGWLRCHAAQAGPCQASTRSSSCALAAGVHVVLRAGVPALPQAVSEDGE